MAVGHAKKDKIFYSKAKGLNNLRFTWDLKLVVMESMALWLQQNLMKIQMKKPTVQVGDPFTEKLLMEACLELMKDNSIISIQDMGAAGLTSSSVEMASKGNLGIEIELDKVPCRRKI